MIRRRREVRRRSFRLAAALTVLVVVPVVGFTLFKALTPSQDTTSTVAQGYPLNSHPTRHWHHWRHLRGSWPTPTVTPSAVPTTSAAPTPAPTSPRPIAVKPPGTGPVENSAPPTVSGIPKSGVPAGQALKSMGQTTITKSGTVIDGADIHGGVVVAASDVIIRDSKIEGQGDWGVYVRSGSLTLEDSTITGFDNSMAGDNYTATRVEVTKANDDGFKIGNNVTIQDSYCHDLIVESGAHSDCGQVQNGIRNAVIRDNWFDVGNGDGNSALFLAPDLGPSSAGPLTVENNVLGGGNITLQCVDGDNGRYFIGNITIKNNSFLSNSRYGSLRVNVAAAVSGNVMRGTNKAVSY